MGGNLPHPELMEGNVTYLVHTTNVESITFQLFNIHKENHFPVENKNCSSVV
jgi:hypothetical protein